MDRKSLLRWEIKNADAGEVTAVIATLGVVDSDGDVTVAGAFKDGAEVLISAYQHGSWGGPLPVGKGIIRTTDTEAILEGKYFLDTEAGRDHFTVAKHLGELGQWSYGYDPLKYSFGEFEGKQVRFLEELHVYEASQVVVGAGVNTRTTGTKGMKFCEHGEVVLAAFTEYIDRTADVVAMRSEKGKALGADSADLAKRIGEQAQRLAGLLVPEPVGPSVDEGAAAEAQREYLRYLQSTS